MRRVSIYLVVLLLCSVAAYAFDAVGALGVGSFTQKGEQPSWVFTAGFEAPIVTVDANGYELVNQTTYVYSDFGVNGVTGIDEVYAVRTYFINRKSIITTPTVTFFTGFGSGGWKFTNTGGGDETAGAFLLQLGLTWNMMDFIIEAENIFIPDERDAYVVGVNVNIGI